MAMRSIEVEGDDIDQAITNALRALQVERDRVEVEILSAASRGLFGFGGRKARIRATVRAPLTALGDGTEAPSAPSSAREVVARETPSTDHPPARLSGPTTGGVPIGAAARAADFLRELIARIGTDCRVEPHDDGSGAVVLTVSGPQTALVIGRRGQTLDAIEYLVNRIAARDEEPSAIPRFVVDAENYRARRQEYLEDLAVRLCAKVRKTGRPVTLNPMTPRDRRIVHLTVQKHAGLMSRSQGEGHVRAMMIVPEDRERRPSRGSGRSSN